MSMKGILAGAAVRRLRLAAQVSQVQLARLVHVNQAHLSRIELGERRVTPEMDRKIRAAIAATLNQRLKAVARLTGSKG